MTLHVRLFAVASFAAITRRSRSSTTAGEGADSKSRR